MPLSTVTLNTNMQWTLTRTNTGYGSTSEGPDSLNFTLSGISKTTFNQLAALQYTLAGSGTQTVDLTSLTNLVYESFSFGHALTIMVLAFGANVTMQPGSSNGFNWFLNSTGILTITNGGCLMWSDSPTATGTAVTGTAKTLLFTNTSSSVSATVDIVILGSTT